MTATCSVDGCGSPVRARGWCNKHWQRWYNSGTVADPVKPPRPICSVGGCDRQSVARGWCLMHYKRWRSRGSADHEPFSVVAPQPRIDPLRRVLDQLVIDPSHGCWVVVNESQSAYTLITVQDNGRRMVPAHRLVYERLVGPIPRGHHAHHACRVPRCVNPEHIVPMSPEDHSRHHVLGTAVTIRPPTVGKRRQECHAVDTGLRRPSPSGSSCIVWSL